LVKGD